MGVRIWKLDSDTDYDNKATPDSPKLAVQSDSAVDETSNTTRTPRECSPEFFPKTDGLSEGTDMYSYIEPDAETTLEQPNLTPINHRSTKYNFRISSKPNCEDDYIYFNFWAALLCSTKAPKISRTRYGIGM